MAQSGSTPILSTWSSKFALVFFDKKYTSIKLEKTKNMALVVQAGLDLEKEN